MRGNDPLVTIPHQTHTPFTHTLTEGWSKVPDQHNKTVQSPLMVGYKWRCHLALETFWDIDALHVIVFLYFVMSLICVVLVVRKAAPQLLCSVRAALSWNGRIYVDNQPIHYCTDTGVSTSLCWFHLSYLCSKQDRHRGQSFRSCRPTADMHISPAIRFNRDHFYLFHAE